MKNPILQKFKDFSQMIGEKFSIIKKPQKIEVFVRHCSFSDISKHKKRPEDFEREKCYQNLLKTLDPEKVNLTFFLDTFHEKKDHFLLSQEKYPVVEIKEGKEASSFLRVLEYVEKLKLHSDTILYFLEDDYIHRDGWTQALIEAFEIENVDYVTLYDHKDKYFLPVYEKLTSKIFHTDSCHWRTTPSTTNTFAVRLKTLKKDFSIHREFSKGRKITEDHAKFCKLREKGAIIISPIPGFSTHADPEFESPCIDWEKVLS